MVIISEFTATDQKLFESQWAHTSFAIENQISSVKNISKCRNFSVFKIVIPHVFSGKTIHFGNVEFITQVTDPTILNLSPFHFDYSKQIIFRQNIYFRVEYVLKFQLIQKTLRQKHLFILTLKRK